MKNRTRKLLRIALFFLVGLSMILAILLFWISEPYHNNPFKELPKAYSKSEVNFNCDESYGKVFQLKADSLLNSTINLNDFIGISTGVSTLECGKWFSTGGYQDKKQGIKADKNTLFRLASISKSFTAVAIMQLVEKGILDLDTAIQEYLPKYPKSDKGDITIRQLLNHTSGIVHYQSTLAAVSFKHYDNLLHACDKFKDEALVFKPGSKYLYTTYGYTVLGAIIEEVSGQTYKDYMETNIWLPAEMLNTSIEDKNLTYLNKAKLYVNFNGKFYKSPNTDLSVKYSGGGIQSNAEDMLKFGEAIINNELIDSSTLAKMIRIDSSIEKGGTPYGLGWFIESNDEHGRVIQHGGSQSGTSTFFRIYLDKKVVVASLANSFESNDETYFLSQNLANLALDSTANIRKINYSKPRSKSFLRSFIGEYKNVDKNEFFDFTMKGGQLYAELKPYPKLPIFPSSDNQFYYRHFDGQLLFSTDSKKESLKYYYKGELNKFEKIK